MDDFCKNLIDFYKNTDFCKNRVLSDPIPIPIAIQTVPLSDTTPPSLPQPSVIYGTPRTHFGDPIWLWRFWSKLTISMILMKIDQFLGFLDTHIYFYRLYTGIPPKTSKTATFTLLLSKSRNWCFSPYIGFWLGQILGSFLTPPRLDFDGFSGILGKAHQYFCK